MITTGKIYITNVLRFYKNVYFSFLLFALVVIFN